MKFLKGALKFNFNYVKSMFEKLYSYLNQLQKKALTEVSAF